MRKKSLGLNAVLNGIRSVLNILFPIITFPYVSRVLGVNGIGIYNFSNSIVSYFLLIAALGINTYAIREGAKLRDDETAISKFASEIFTINMCSTLLSYILLFLCLILFSKLHNYTACILIFSLQIIFATIGTEWIYQIYEDYSYITLRSVIFQIVSIALLFIFVRGPQDYLKYASITVFSSGGANILNFIHAKKYCRIRLIWKFNWKNHLTPILIIFGASIANMIYVNSDITLLGLMKNNYVVGIYSVSSKVYQIVKTLIAALLIVTVPRLAMLFGKKKITEYKAILLKLTKILLIFALPASVGLFMLAREVILIISGSHYLRATNSLKILSLTYVFSILAWILTDCVLIPAKREKYVLRSMSVSAIVNIVINLALIPYFSENAAAASTVLAELSMLIINYYYAKDLVKDIFISSDLVRNIIDALIGSIGIVLVCIICNILYRGMLLKTILSVSLSVVTYGSILLLLKNQIVMSIFNRIKLILVKTK